MLVATPMAVLPIPMTTWYRTTWTFWGWSSACVPWCCVWSGQPGWPFTVPASLSPTRNWTTIPSKSCRVLCFPSLQLSCLICKIRLPWLCPEQLEFNKALKPASLHTVAKLKFLSEKSLDWIFAIKKEIFREWRYLKNMNFCARKLSINGQKLNSASACVVCIFRNHFARSYTRYLHNSDPKIHFLSKKSKLIFELFLVKICWIIWQKRG